MLPWGRTSVAARVAATRAAALAVVAAAALLSPAVDSAWGSGPTFALKPTPPTKTGYFVFKAQPGQTVHGQVRVLNVGSKAGRTALYSVDATTGQTSGAVYRSRNEPTLGVGRWTSIQKSALTLASGASQLVRFTTRVPANTTPGQYLGGIVAQRSIGSTRHAAGGGKGSFKVRIQTLSVIAVQIDVPGPRHPKMKLSGIKVGNQPGHQSLLLGIGNTGNVLVKGSGSLKVSTAAGVPQKHATFALDTFVPATHIGFPVYIQGKPLKPGHYRGTVSVTYDGHTITRTFPFAITSAQVKQVFGSPTAQSASGSSSSDGTLVAVLAAVSVVSVATAAFFFLRSRRVV